MRKTELREVVVTYCDVCGQEITGNYTVFHSGQPNEAHACHGWNEAGECRCDDALEQRLLAARRAQPAP